MRWYLSLFLMTVIPALPGTAESPALPAGEITRNIAIQAALQSHPRLAAYAFEVQAQEALIAQAGARPNPTLSLEIEDLALQGGGTTERSRSAGLGGDGLSLGRERVVESERGGAARALEATLLLSQPIELGGKRARRLRLASLDHALAQWDYEAVRAEVIAEVAQRFHALSAAQADLVLAQERHEISTQLHELVRARVEAGDAAPLALKRAGAEQAATAIAVGEARAAVAARRAALAATWGGAGDDLVAVDATYGAPAPLPGLQDWLDRAALHPDVARWRSELSQREAVLALARAEAVPDLELGVGLRTTRNPSSSIRGAGSDLSGLSRTRGSIDPENNADWSLVIEAGIALPLFDRNRGNIRAAEHRTSAAEAGGRAALMAAQSTLTDAHHRAMAALTTWRSLGSTVLPGLTESLTLTREGYAAGKFSLHEVLESEQALAEARQQANAALANHWLARTELERLAGETTEEIAAAAPSAPLLEESTHE
jgi:cobalt-zinc-cadmium efflux system outer membrane protein